MMILLIVFGDIAIALFVAFLIRHFDNQNPTYTYNGKVYSKDTLYPKK